MTTTVYFRVVEHDQEVSEFETKYKVWDFDDSDWESLTDEISEYVYDNQDGYEWWKQEESITIEVYWGEGAENMAPETLRITCRVTMTFSPSFDARKIK